MKILHTADWHIGQFKGPVENGVNLRAQDTVNCLNHMVKTAREEKPELVLVSGDVFHQEQIGPVRYSDEMVIATNIIEKLAEVAKLVVVMRGTPNHDGSGQWKVLEKMFRDIDKVEIVTSPQIISTPLADIACIPGFDKQEFRVRFSGLSADEENNVWTEYIGNTVMALKAQCSPDKPSILMAHYTVPGCNMESGQTSFFANFEPVIPRETLQAAEFDLVALGHVHRPQQLTGLNNVFYSGAANAMNFNDEGQERGFWIHEMNEAGLSINTFVQNPYRQFQTISWEQEDVELYLREGELFLRSGDLPELVADKIIRLHYKCTADQKKRLNVPILQQNLYDIGAFYVSDIEAESMVDFANRGLLSEESDPLENLKKWLNEKCFKDPDDIASLAEPIIAEALKQSSTAEIHGVFKPVSIAVKNYRSYKEESFDFLDISFCTINGVNGAGKSSLFMDAIVDALFEETRDGDAKSWIRGSEDARSGSIEFVFDIGKSRFRVVRTRTKSGRPTLNLSQMSDDSEWLNLSKERVIDTQKEIERVLGMDSMTFRSCALIMQDQYGLFLQAKKEERIAILGNLLGLGIYGIMEADARRHLGDSKRDLMARKEAVKVKTEFIDSKGNPEHELDLVTGLIEEDENRKTVLASSRAKVAALASSLESLRQRREKKTQERREVMLQIEDNNIALKKAQDIIADCDTTLKLADAIRSGAEAYQRAQGETKKLYPDTVKYKQASQDLRKAKEEQQRYETLIRQSEAHNKAIEQKLAELSASDDIREIDKHLEQLEAARRRQEEIAEEKTAYTALKDFWSGFNAKKTAEIAEKQKEISLLEVCVNEELRSQTFIANSGCIDIGRADCQFLKKAKEDVAFLEEDKAKLELLRKELEALKEALVGEEKLHLKRLEDTGYSRREEVELLDQIQKLLPWMNARKRAEEKRSEIASLTADKAANDKTIGLCTENRSTALSEVLRITQEVSDLSESVKKYNEAVEEEKKCLIYSETAKTLPVLEERKANALEKVSTTKAAIAQLEKRLEDLLLEEQKIIREQETIPANVEEELTQYDLQLKEIENRISKHQITKGSLTQKIEDINQLRTEIAELNKEIDAAAQLVVRYDALKQAFSQDGVPHQIIRNIIPHITDTANNILGAMTGGTMGVDFVMEKTVKGKDGDKATLDVLINEYGKTTLPYASKSGGEKVKSSLAVILALAEIKTTVAGIQLGMLFIDEPPFLDDDGTQAYVDSLETIRQRYPDIKIMAITHDEAMKARFMQSVTVVKTEDGSKVVY